MKEELIRPKLEKDLEKIRECIMNDEYSMNDLRILHHMERYEFVAHYINDNFQDEVNILDVGCGLGHGLNVLNQNLEPHIDASICGIDIDSSSIKKASNFYNNFSFICDDICVANMEGEFDVIIFFEVLGNENIQSDEVMLKKFKNILLDDGCIFISIPSYRDNEPKSYFARLYNQKSFNEIISLAYNEKYVSFYGQMHPVNRGNILTEENISSELYEPGDFMLAVIGGKK
jgi:2-polyprenyl-3-methyl-5-hydroxy-6-metoxy-1,4-benzoquinol methylase